MSTNNLFSSSVGRDSYGAKRCTKPEVCELRNMQAANPIIAPQFEEHRKVLKSEAIDALQNLTETLEDITKALRKDREGELFPRIEQSYARYYSWATNVIGPARNIVSAIGLIKTAFSRYEEGLNDEAFSYFEQLKAPLDKIFDLAHMQVMGPSLIPCKEAIDFESLLCEEFCDSKTLESFDLQPWKLDDMKRFAKVAKKALRKAK